MHTLVHAKADHEMNAPSPPPAGLRHLTSRTYAGAQARQWARGWHAPRLNRWERLQVSGANAVLNRLEPSEVTTLAMVVGEHYWIGPGERWRLASLEPGASLEIAPHAQDAASSSRPPRTRERWLEGVSEVNVASASALRELLDALPSGERRLCFGAFDWSSAVAQADVLRRARLSWHPLLTDRMGRFSALAIHAADTVDLMDYLGRDHALIEAALSLALRGGHEARARFRSLLLRHVAIEEALLFPAYETTDERARMVRGLLREHRYIEECLERDEDPHSLRRLWRLLEAHDEKEELLVYPDIGSGRAEGNLLPKALTFPPRPV